MHETTNQPKPTPVRRRQGRNTAKVSGQKMYASENDAATVGSGLGYNQPEHPQTPQKYASGSPEPQSFSGNGTSKQRPRNMLPTNKSMTSPDSSRHARQTPPHGIPINKPSSSTAFAGATFHASPAPSALPIPSFYSKSIPESPSIKDHKPATQQPSPPDTERDIPTPVHTSVPKAHESPLEAIFRADRAEKEKARRTSSANSHPVSQSPLSPPGPSPRRQAYDSLPKPYNTHPGHSMQFRRSSGAMSSSELDVTPGKPLGPAFSTPYQERIRAARAIPSPPPTNSQAPQQPPVEDRTDALKKFLFGGKLVAGSLSSSSTPPRPGQRGEETIANTPNKPQEGRPADLLAMEDNLRRILKLDSPLDPATRSGERPLYS